MSNTNASQDAECGLDSDQENLLQEDETIPAQATVNFPVETVFQTNQQNSVVEYCASQEAHSPS